jgi:hypothetical protein
MTPCNRTSLSVRNHADNRFWYDSAEAQMNELWRVCASYRALVEKEAPVKCERLRHHRNLVSHIGCEELKVSALSRHITP